MEALDEELFVVFGGWGEARKLYETGG